MKYIVPLYLWEYNQEFQVYSTVDPKKVRKEEGDGEIRSDLRQVYTEKALCALRRNRWIGRYIFGVCK